MTPWYSPEWLKLKRLTPPNDDEDQKNQTLIHCLWKCKNYTTTLAISYKTKRLEAARSIL